MGFLTEEMKRTQFIRGLRSKGFVVKASKLKSQVISLVY